jgi:hypothetical protein
MPTFELDVIQNVHRGGVPLGTHPHLALTPDVLKVGGLTMMARIDAQLGGEADLFPYRHFDVHPATHYHVEVHDKDGRLKWCEDFDNLVTTEGMNALLDALFKTGLQSPAWYFGLVDGATEPAYLPGDVLGGHTGWTENTGYDETPRQSLVLGDIAGGAVDNTASRAKFTITADGTQIAGAFLTDASDKGGTSGKLYGVGGFSGGVRGVDQGDTLRVAVTLSVAE